MLRRIGIGLLLIGALVGIYLLDTHVLDRPLIARILLWLLALGALHETLALGARRIECNPGLFFYGGVAVIAVVVPCLVLRTPVPGALLALAAVGAGGVRLLGMAPLRSAAAALPEAVLLAGAVLYTAGLLSFLDRILVRGGVEAAFAVVAVSKASDIGGYFVGTLVGRRRITPAVSPKKTWEGTIAGLLASAGVAGLLYLELMSPAGWGTPAFAAGIGVLLGGASLLGDLIESGLKRWAGVKDSAALLPEFGGILDLLDGILVAGPVAVVCLFGS
ncbi:MAG: phosphatidate cytidylyltransferase [Planctomycetota bacterium]|jgi:phosphatidate cytidylyltransferase